MFFEMDMLHVSVFFLVQALLCSPCSQMVVGAPDLTAVQQRVRHRLESELDLLHAQALF